MPSLTRFRVYTQWLAFPDLQQHFSGVTARAVARIGYRRNMSLSAKSALFSISLPTCLQVSRHHKESVATKANASELAEHQR